MKTLPYVTTFRVIEPPSPWWKFWADLRRRKQVVKALAGYLRARAKEGWFVQTNDHNRPEWIKVFHVGPVDLPPPPLGIIAETRENPD